MDTWEVVLILVLLTISISSIAKRYLPISLISVLDNIYFQLVILGLTLGVAILSPPVAIVAISTIVIVYYVRNLVKVEIAQDLRRLDRENEQRLNEQRIEELEKNQEPRIEIREETHTVTEIVANKDTIEAALKEHETRQPADSQTQVGNRSSLSGTPPVKQVEKSVHDEIPDPRGQQKGVESFDIKANNNSPAPVGTERRPLMPVDSDVFTPSNHQVNGSNESKAPVITLRAYNDNAGQYDINESRPQGSVERYEIADYMPLKDSGANDFEPVGKSIDDKIKNLSRGIMPSSAAPPDFNKVLPTRAH